MFNRILVGIDGSKNSLVASEYGIFFQILHHFLKHGSKVDTKTVEE